METLEMGKLVPTLFFFLIGDLVAATEKPAWWSSEDWQEQ